MENKTNDKYLRSFYIRPELGKMHIYNRPFYFTNLNAITHSNDLANILHAIDPQLRPCIIGMTSDNGPDFSPESYLVFFALGRLWKTFDLDQLILTSFAPGESKYNFIERRWARYSTELAGVTLCPDAKNYDKSNDVKMKQLFSKALEQLHGYWHRVVYNDYETNNNTIEPGQAETPWNDYENLQDLFHNLEKSKYFSQYKSDVKFLMRHCIRRSYFLHFRKCSRSECKHCYKTVKDTEAMAILEKLSHKRCLPPPQLLKQYYNGDHYPSLIDLVNNEELRKVNNS